MVKYCLKLTSLAVIGLMGVFWAGYLIKHLWDMFVVPANVVFSWKVVCISSIVIGCMSPAIFLKFLCDKYIERLQGNRRESLVKHICTKGK